MFVRLGKYTKDDRRERQMVVRIHKYDTWSLDHTLAHIIAPAVRQLAATSHSHPCDFSNYEEWVTVLDKIATAFEMIRDGYADDITEKYFAHRLPLQFSDPDENGYRTMIGTVLPDDERDAFRAEMAAADAKIQEGLDLFAKYYRSLWD